MTSLLTDALEISRCTLGESKTAQTRAVEQKVGLADFKFHDLRKTFRSVLAQNGVSIVVI
jgi:integrase